MAELIVALDFADSPSAVAFLDQLPDGCAVKVGSVMLARAGAGFVRGLVAGGHPVFLDPKWHDIPNTVAGACNAAVDLGVEMVTVHASGGEAMTKARRLRELLASDALIVAPGVYDGVSAALVGAMGFVAAYMTGAGISNCTGPGLPAHISRNAMRTTSGMRSKEKIGAPHFTAALNTSSWSWPWKVVDGEG